MSEPATERLIEIVGEAMRREPASREIYVRESCKSPDDFAEAMSLLKALEDAGGFMDRPTLDRSHESTVQERERPGTMVGRYRLIRQIGEGGFGIVFLAEQCEPVKREVALKIIKLGMDTKAVIARFEQERQALALMDHPNIAKVLDAGATETGRPYFVMELVKGDPITKFCDAQGLTIAQRLELFTQVCRAVQHAHSKGIIHRDIKPSNVLVGTQDGRATARVIDFGIAKATSLRLTEKTVFTEDRHLIGTPEYMSPEQAGGGIDIDTRTDVYSLGVMLYELLTGATPFDGARLRSAAFGELQRIIREDDPPAPSTRLSQSGERLAGIAARRRIEPAKLRTTIRGDLDWIVLRALEKERARRYETPGNLATDIERYLGGIPVEAAPPGAWYRARKFARRNRGVVVSVGFIAGALVLGMAATLLALVEVREQRDRASDAEARARELLAESERARQEAEHAKAIADAARAESERFNRAASAVTEFFTHDVLDLKPVPAGEPELTVREVLDRIPDKIKGNFGHDPVTEGMIRERVGQLYLNLGSPKRAAEFLESAYALFEKGLSPEHRTTLLAAQRLAEVSYVLERLDRAEELFGRVHEARLRVLGREHNFTWNSLMRRGMARVAAGKHEAGLKDIDEAVSQFKRLRGEFSRTALIVLDQQVRAYAGAGRAAEAEAIARACLDAVRARPGELGAAEPSFRDGLARALRHQMKHDEALIEIDAALARLTGAYPPEHDSVLDARSNRAEILLGLGRHADARAELEGCYPILALHMGADAPAARRAALTLATACAAMGDHAAAAAWDRKARAMPGGVERE